MPKGIITRLIVRLHDKIAKTSSGKQDLVWEKGVILTCRGCKALVVEDEHTKTGLKIIEIEVTGADHEKKYMLRTVRDEIISIHKKWFPNLNFEQLVPCNCKECLHSVQPTFFEFQRLEKYREHNRKYIDCLNVGFQEVEVISLIEGVFERDSEP